jgi:AraC-like DNA-binding protein
MNKGFLHPEQAARQQLRGKPGRGLPSRSEGHVQLRDMAVMSGIQRVRADLSHNSDREQMFDDVRELVFDDQANGWLETAVGKLGSSGIGLWRVRSSGHRISIGVPSQSTLLLPLSGSVCVDVAGSEINATAGEALIVGAGPRRTRTISRVREPYDALALMFPSDLAGKAAPGGRGFNLPGNGGLASYVRYLAVEAQEKEGVLSRPNTQQAAAALLAEYLATIVDDRQEKGAVRVAASLLQIKRAEEIMRENFEEPLTISELSRQVGVSPRSLQLAFRAHRSVGPIETLSRIRLENARLRLLNAGPFDSVSGIALDCGFSHLGRFSIFYRAAFGETPSDTLKRRSH